MPQLNNGVGDCVIAFVRKHLADKVLIDLWLVEDSN